MKMYTLTLELFSQQEINKKLKNMYLKIHIFTTTLFDNLKMDEEKLTPALIGPLDLMTNIVTENL